MSVCLFKQAPRGTQETVPNLTQPVPEVFRRPGGSSSLLPPSCCCHCSGRSCPAPRAPSSEQEQAVGLMPAPWELTDLTTCPRRVPTPHHPPRGGRRPGSAGSCPGQVPYLSCPTNLHLPAAATAAGAFVSLLRSFWEVMKSMCQHNAPLRKALERI